MAANGIQDEAGTDQADNTASPAGISWLNTAEAARRLGVTPRTLYRFIDEGQLPAYRFGRVIRLKENEVDEFIERCRIPPGGLDLRGSDDYQAATAATIEGNLR